MEIYEKILASRPNIKLIGSTVHACMTWDVFLSKQNTNNFSGNFLELGVSYGAAAIIMGFHQKKMKTYI